ncbi:hypothetical protein K493DRAFT_191748, partial [Basidiobolus meristosporus CBS 931.73]
PLKSFVHRLVCRGKLTTNILVASLLYLHRHTRRREAHAAPRSRLSKELLFLVSVITATKYLEDHPLTTFKVVNIMRERWDSADVNQAEREFLEDLQYGLWIDSDEFRE